MLGLDNPIHIAFLLILLLLVFGAKRLPEMGRSLGSGMRGFKDSLSGEDTHSALAAAAPASTPVTATPAPVAAAAPVAATAAPVAAAPVTQPVPVATAAVASAANADQSGTPTAA